MQPAVSLLRGQAKGHGSKEDRCGDFALPVISRPMTCIHDTFRNGLKHAQCRHYFSGAIHVDRQPTVTHFLDRACKIFCGKAQAGEILRPSCNHLPLKMLASGAAGRRIIAVGRLSVPPVCSPKAECRHERGYKQQNNQWHRLLFFRGVSHSRCYPHACRITLTGG